MAAAIVDVNNARSDMVEKSNTSLLQEFLQYPVEIRIPKAKGKSTAAGYFDNYSDLIRAIKPWNGKKNIYMVINPVTRDLLARYYNRLELYADNLTKDEDIERLLKLLLDVDARRASGISANDAEKEKAMAKIQEIREYLLLVYGIHTWLGDSGNGGHAPIDIDLPNTAENKTGCQNILAYLAHIFDDPINTDGKPSVNVDRTTFSPAQPCKLYGTIAAKGDNVPARPHRRSQLLERPEVAGPQDITALMNDANEWVAADNAKKKQHNTKPGRRDMKGIDAAEWLARHNIEVVEIKQRSYGTIYVLDHCLMDDSHGNDRSAVVVQRHDGALSYTCQHNRCSHYKWADFRRKYEARDDFNDGSPLNWDGSREIGSPKDNAPDPPADQGQRGSYFDEHGTFIPAYLADELLTSFHLKTAASELWTYKAGVYLPGGKNLVAAEAQRRLGPLTRTSRIKETLDYIERATYTELPEPNLDYINVLNGRLNWRTGELLPHSPGYFEIVQLPVVYDPAAKCPVFDNYLATTLDKDSRQLAIEILAICLIPTTRYEKAFMLTGIGRNGKSIFLWIIDNLIGFQNVSHIPLQDLEENKFRVAGLLGKLVNTFADLDSRALKSTSLLKMLTSGDPLEAERKFKDPFSFRNYARMVFSANQIPRSSDTTFAFYERWIILPFEKVFDNNNPATDPDLRGKLATPGELSGIFNRALTGLQNLDLLGSFTQPESVRKALAEYMQSNDSVLAFCEECIEPDGFTSKPALYSSYKLWCDQQGLKPVSQKKLKPSLLQVYPNITENREGSFGSRGWSGIRLNDFAPVVEDYFR